MDVAGKLKKQLELAESLRDYLIQNRTQAAFGTRAERSDPVSDFQRAFDIEANPPGVLGPAERSAARQVGVLLPERPLPELEA